MIIKSSKLELLIWNLVQELLFSMTNLILQEPKEREDSFLLMTKKALAFRLLFLAKVHWLKVYTHRCVCVDDLQRIKEGVKFLWFLNQYFFFVGNFFIIPLLDKKEVQIQVLDDRLHAVGRTSDLNRCTFSSYMIIKRKLIIEWNSFKNYGFLIQIQTWKV